MARFVNSMVPGLRTENKPIDVWIKPILIGIFGYQIGKLIIADNYLALGAIAYLSLFFLPEFSLLIFCFIATQISPTEYFRLGAIGPLDIYFWDPLIIMILIKFGSLLLLKRRRFFSTPINPLVYVLFSFGLISVIHSYYRFGEEHFLFTLVSLLRNFYFVLMFFLVSNLVDSKDKIRIFIKVILFLIVFQVGLAVIQRIGAFTGFTTFMHIFSPVKGAYGSIDFRSVGTIGNPNLFGQAMILLSFTVTMSFFQKSRSISTWFLIPLILAGIAITGSRSAYIGTIVLLLVLFSQLKEKRVSRFIQFVTAFGIIFYFLWDYILHRVLLEFSVFDIGSHEFLLDPASSLTTRTDLWQMKLSLAALSPIFGYGWSGSFLASSVAYGLYTDSHNQYIETLVDLGIPGLIIFLSLLAYIVYLTWDLRNITNDPFFAQMSKALFTSFVGFYVTMFGIVTLETGNPTSSIFWALVGLVMSARGIAEREKAIHKVDNFIANKINRY
jgi:O-antigen ligase